MSGCKDCAQYDKRIKELKEKYELLNRQLKKTYVRKDTGLKGRSRLMMILSVIKSWITKG